MNQETADAITHIEALNLLLDQVDYMADNCRMNEMVGAVLPIQVIEICRNSLVSEDEQDEMGDCPFCFQPFITIKTDTEIAKQKIEEYIEIGLPIKYNEGAPYGWQKGITYKYELGILKDCIDWLDKEGE